MKIAVYAIAKNEAKHVERFAAGVAEADHVLVLDTGSTDDTRKALADSGVRTRLKKFSDRVQFRFDDSRNFAMNLLPPDVDVCVALDLDEVPAPGWRRAIEAAWKEGVTRLRYLNVWSHRTDGSPDISFYADKIHARHGYH